MLICYLSKIREVVKRHQQDNLSIEMPLLIYQISHIPVRLLVLTNFC